MHTYKTFGLQSQKKRETNQKNPEKIGENLKKQRKSENKSKKKMGKIEKNWNTRNQNT